MHVCMCVLVACRLLPGTNLDDFCYKVRQATGKLKSPQQLMDVRQWMWNFSMHAMHLLVQVGLPFSTYVVQLEARK